VPSNKALFLAGFAQLSLFACGEDPDAYVSVIECDENADCDNGNFCDGQEHCVRSQCIRGPALDCNDGADCTRDQCFPVYGCRSVPDDKLCASEVQFCDPVYGCRLLPPDWACFDGWDMDGDGLWDCHDPECFKVCEAWSPCPDYCSCQE